MGALIPQHRVEGLPVAALRGRHQLEEEVVPVATGARAWFREPAIQFGATRRGQVVDHPIRLDLLVLALRGDEAVPAEPVEDLVQVPDVKPAPLLTDGLLKAGL